MRTIVVLPLRMLVTITLVPNGNVRCAAVCPVDPVTSPLAVRAPLWKSGGISDLAAAEKAVGCAAVRSASAVCVPPAAANGTLLAFVKA